MTKSAIQQRREARLAAVHDQRRDDAELDLPLLIQARTIVETALATVRADLAAIMPQLIGENPTLAQQVSTLGLLEKNLTTLLKPMIANAEATLAGETEAAPPEVAA